MQRTAGRGRAVNCPLCRALYWYSQTKFVQEENIRATDPAPVALIDGDRVASKWQWKGNHNDWFWQDANVSNILEKHYSDYSDDGGLLFSEPIQIGNYIFDLSRMVQTNIITQNERDIFRI